MRLGERPVKIGNDNTDCTNARRAPFWRCRGSEAVSHSLANKQSRVEDVPGTEHVGQRGVIHTPHTPPGRGKDGAVGCWQRRTRVEIQLNFSETVSRAPCPWPFKLLQIDRCNFWLAREWSNKPGRLQNFLPPKTFLVIREHPKNPRTLLFCPCPLGPTAPACPVPRARGADLQTPAGLPTASLFSLFFFSLAHAPGKTGPGGSVDPASVHV